MRAVTLTSLVAAIPGCAVIAGGLDEGRPRPAFTAPDAAAAADDAHAPCDSDWPPGATSRAVFEVSSKYAVPITDYTLPLRLDTRLLLARGSMQRDGSDLRVTAPDGTGRRFLLPSPVDSEAAVLWVRHDVPPGRSLLFVYFGGAPELDVTPRRDVFFDDIIPPLDPTSGAWTRDSELNTMADGGATPRVRFQAPRNNVSASWCTTLALPEGHHWQILFDARPGALAGGKYLVRVDNTAFFFGTEPHPLDDAYTSGDFGIEPGGARTLCFRVELSDREPRNGDEVSATFSRPRVRVFVPFPPEAILIQTEAAPCVP